MTARLIEPREKIRRHYWFVDVKYADGWSQWHSYFDSKPEAREAVRRNGLKRGEYRIAKYIREAAK